MQTGCEDWPVYVALGASEDRQRMWEEIKERFREAPSGDDGIVYEIAPRFYNDYPLVRRSLMIAYFMGGRDRGKHRTDNQRRNQTVDAADRTGTEPLHASGTAGHEPDGTHHDAGRVNGDDAGQLPG